MILRQLSRGFNRKNSISNRIRKISSYQFSSEFLESSNSIGLKEYINVLKMGNITDIFSFEEFKLRNNLDSQIVTFNEISRSLERKSEYSHFSSFENSAMAQLNVPGVTIIRTVADAKRAIKILYEFRDRVHAWDTETVDLEVKEESPVLNGKVICLQAFLGMDVPFWNGPRLFVDNFCDAEGIIQEFSEYFADPSVKKIWFNYGFDRHVIENHGLKLDGFHADVMQMARLVDPSRLPGDYSLSKCTAFYEEEILQVKQKQFEEMSAQLDHSPVSGRNIFTEYHGCLGLLVRVRAT